jgi:fibrillarin-like pre-rRNA processing protein
VAILVTGRRGVFTDGSWLYTRNLVPGRAVYGERLVVQGDVEYRRWDAERSKLAAYLKRGGSAWPFEASSRVLYLGAASGTTVSHVSDICRDGTITAVEVAPRAFRDLVALAGSRPNVLPILADASRPDAYEARVGIVDVVYQDIAQRDQEAIFRRNLRMLRPDGTGILMEKARSADVAAAPGDVYRAAKASLVAADLDVLDLRPLDPHAVDHAAIVVRRRA